MRAITNDRRYGALKTLGERKQTFNEVSLSVLLFWMISNMEYLTMLYRSVLRSLSINVCDLFSVCQSKEKTGG